VCDRLELSRQDDHTIRIELAFAKQDVTQRDSRLCAKWKQLGELRIVQGGKSSGEFGGVGLTGADAPQGHRNRVRDALD
jgi:hypothetical protein